jgi:hypothetical protein
VRRQFMLPAVSQRSMLWTFWLDRGACVTQQLVWEFCVLD